MTSLPINQQENNASSPRDLESARKTLLTEAKALEALATSLDETFAQAVEILLNVTGRVIISGMGKSGHVARKIAATMASTGTPAFFVHPGEASHGDLGMVNQRDAVLALSNSGKVKELSDMIAYTRRYDIPLIAITSNADSPLATASDVCLLLPKQPEAGSLGLAPTTSTTMQIALGDALAVALFERRGFTPDDFKVFHPGGSLGQQLARVRDLMHSGSDLPLIDQTKPMSEALLTMTEKGFGCVGVVDETGRLQGIITDGDLRRHMGNDLVSLSVKAVMTSQPRTIEAEALAVKCLALMSLHSPRITNLFVVEEGKPIGIIHVHDLLRAGIT